METDVREVSFEEALAEEGQHDQVEGGDAAPRPRPAPGGPHTNAAESDQEHTQAPPTPPPSNSEAETAAEQAKEDIEILAPPIEAKQWAFGEGEARRTYVQSELSVTGSAQWFALLGEFLDKAMSGENHLSLNSLLSPPKPREGAGQFQLADFQDADMFVHALGKLLMVMPEFLEKSVCIWLDVPDYEWELVRLLMRRSPKRGGMSPETFEGILETFIDQNYAEIDRFFRVRFQRLRARWRARAKEASQSRSSKH